MAKELPIYPELEFELGEFIRSKEVISANNRVVENTFYYEKGIIKRNYEYNEERKNYEESLHEYYEIAPEDIKAILTELMIKEEKELV